MAGDAIVSTAAEQLAAAVLSSAGIRDLQDIVAASLAETELLVQLTNGVCFNLQARHLLLMESNRKQW